jgi:3-isopropylmalate/(R)-2-methylmalate dehydratase small subunit
MKAVRVHTGTAVPLPRSDVDTDQIIPSDWLKRVERTGFGRGLFSEWRDEPSFVLNDERFAGASILVAGPNFGVGSSREHAVWALMDYGFDVVIAPRFGDIFRNNSTKNGLVPVVLSEEVVTRLHVALEDDPATEIVIDVERLVVEVPSLGIVEAFALDESTQHRFLHGLDDIGISLSHEDEIAAFEKSRPAWLPSVS